MWCRMLKMPAPIPPKQLKLVLELADFALLAEDEFNWAMAKCGGGIPIIIPKEGDYVAVEVMEDVLGQAGLARPGDYFPLRDESARRLGLTPN